MAQPKNKQFIDLRFLEGPRSRWKEFTSVISISREFIHGFRKLHFVGPCVTFFGSARFKEDHPYYEAARELARRVGRVGFTIMTGGGDLQRRVIARSAGGQQQGHHDPGDRPCR